MKNVSPLIRFRYIMTWIKHPMIVISILLVPILFCTILVLSFPCGKYSHPVGHGVCDSGNPFISPLDSLLIGAIIGIVGVIIIGMSEPYSKSRNIVRASISRVSNQPKWRKRWYPPTFVVIYIPIAIVWYVLFKDDGLYWYSYVGQYALILPMITASLTAGVTTVVRKRLRKRLKKVST